MKVSIDQSLCIMCHACVTECPEVLEVTEEGTVGIKDEYKDVEITDPELQKQLREAAQVCATSALVIEE